MRPKDGWRLHCAVGGAKYIALVSYGLHVRLRSTCLHQRAKYIYVITFTACYYLAGATRIVSGERIEQRTRSAVRPSAGIDVRRHGGVECAQRSAAASMQLESAAASAQQDSPVFRGGEIRRGAHYCSLPSIDLG